MKLTTSYQREINNLCKTLSEGDYNIKEVTAGALSQARAKLNPWAFIRLSDISIDTFYQEAQVRLWKGMRLLAVDGSIINLPHSKSVVEQFGVEDYIRKKGAPKSLARASLLYDVLNQITVDAQLESYQTSEKTLLTKHLDKINSTDLILGDRGYSGIATLHMLSSLGANFCIRMKAGNLSRKEVTVFLKSGKKEDVIFMSSQKYDYRKIGMDENTNPLEVRLVKVELDNGEVEVLATNLFDQSSYPAEIFKNLYILRWPVEEAYKLLKLRLDLESFSGKTARSIRQDFHAKIFMMNLCAVMSHPISEKVRKEYKSDRTNNKYDQQINRTTALAQTKSSIIDLFIKVLHQKVIDNLDRIVESSRTVVRPFRKSRRDKFVKRRKPTNYKPI